MTKYRRAALSPIFRSANGEITAGTIPSFTSENANTARGSCDHDVAARDEPDAAAERVALDDGDDRRGAGVDRLEHAPHGSRIGDVRVDVEIDRGAHPFDVGAGAEARPVAGEHHGAARAHVDERLGELGDQGGIERVARLGPRERDAKNVVAPARCEARPRRTA